MNKQLLVLISLFALVIIVAGCVQPPIKEKTEEGLKETCTAGLKCKDAFTKAYQNTDCNWTSVTDCPYGCENNDCKVPADAMDKIEAAIKKALSK